jgi:hypothetical protein
MILITIHSFRVVCGCRRATARTGSVACDLQLWRRGFDDLWLRLLLRSWSAAALVNLDGSCEWGRRISVVVPGASELINFICVKSDQLRTETVCGKMALRDPATDGQL